MTAFIFPSRKWGQSLFSPEIRDCPELPAKLGTVPNFLSSIPGALAFFMLGRRMALARTARIRVAGLPVHITQRGHAMNACFFIPSDYQRYLDELKEQAQRSGCAVHAFVLMTNHVHLLVTPDSIDGASRMMKQVAQLHAQYVNWRHGRLGALWGDRFHSSLVQCERYFLATSRYIEANPVRARMVPSPEAYPWSSFGRNALGEPSPLITPHPVYDNLGRDPVERLHAYSGLSRDEIDEPTLSDIRTASRKNLPLGDEGYLAQLSALTGRITRPRPRGRPGK